FPLRDLRRRSDRGHVPHLPGKRVHGEAELHISTLGSRTNSAVGLTSLIPRKDRVGLHFGGRVAILRCIMASVPPIPRFLQVPGGSFFLFGPRGTGKTTWLRQQLPEALTINLLRPEVYREMAARPERLRELVRGHPEAKDVVVDEVQRVPELLHVVHDLMESRQAPRFVLTGSSARKLRRGGVDLLAGRAIVESMHPFMAAEMPAFDLENALEI